MAYKVKEISKTYFKIPELNHTIKFKTSKGRVLIICSCDNASYFGHNQFCYHKQLVLKYIFLKPIKEKVNSLISEYKLFKNYKFDGERFVHELNVIKETYDK